MSTLAYGSRRVFSSLVNLLFANPKRPPLKYCGCGTANEPDRTSCIGCGGRF